MHISLKPFPKDLRFQGVNARRHKEESYPLGISDVSLIPEFYLQPRRCIAHFHKPKVFRYP